MSRRTLAAVALALAAVALASIPPFQALLIGNVSQSVPIGLYRLAPGMPKRGDLAVVVLPVPLRAIADARRYLPRSFLLLKPVAAAAGMSFVASGGGCGSTAAHPFWCAPLIVSAGRSRRGADAGA